MTRYLISFDDGAMTFPEEDLPDVAEAAHAVVEEAKDAGIWVFGGGLHSHEEVSVVATDGTVTDGPYPESKAYIGGFSIVDVPSREEALEWAGRIAVACRVPRRFASSCPALHPDRGHPGSAYRAGSPPAQAQSAVARKRSIMAFTCSGTSSW
jgi:hypothetical protein